MQPIDIYNILSSPMPPDEKAIENGLKKGFSLYSKCLADNSPSTNENLIRLGHHFEQEDSKQYGFKKMARALFCYAIAARAGCPNGYKHIIFLLKKRLFVDELYDYQSQELLAFCYEQRNILKNKLPEKIIDIQFDTTLYELYTQYISQKNITLAHRLDNAYEMYQYCQKQLLLLLSTANATMIKMIQVEALTFIQAVLDVDTEEKIHSLMQARETIKQSDPEHIPGKKPQEKLLLNVREKSKEKDKVENTIYLTAEERDDFRTIIIKGEFYERQLNNRFIKVDTQHRLSHNKASFVAYTINPKGEVSLFDHFEINDGFAHSSTNAGGSLFISGELQIFAGRLKSITVYSMHYQPQLKDVYEVLVYFKAQGVDISEVILHTWGEEGHRRGNDFLDYSATEFYEKFPTSGLTQCKQLNKPLAFDEDFEVDFSSNLTVSSGEEKQLNANHLFSSPLSISTPEKGSSVTSKPFSLAL